MNRFALAMLLAACSGPSEDVDAGPDAGSEADAGKPDAGSPVIDAAVDAGMRSDAGTDAGNDACAAMDAMESEPCGPTERPALRYLWDGDACVAVGWCHCAGADCEALFTSEAECTSAYDACLAGCADDRECVEGAEWCVGGRCVECDNSGPACFIVCPAGWSTYMRNGCSPCDCAPMNACTSDRMCGGLNVCHPGAFCTDWCPDDPSCCFGNTCSMPSCDGPPPVGCFVRGCPEGETCTASGCASSSCTCTADGWACTDDCGGGTCVPDEV